jgi:hypothetical protein
MLLSNFALNVTLRPYTQGSISIRDISAQTALREPDIVSALQSLNLLKYWKGQHIISATPKIVEEHLRSFNKSYQIQVVQEWMHWTPPVFQPLPGPGSTQRKGGANR